jgi:hypothetical protein
MPSKDTAQRAYQASAPRHAFEDQNAQIAASSVPFLMKLRRLFFPSNIRKLHPLLAHRPHIYFAGYLGSLRSRRQMALKEPENASYLAAESCQIGCRRSDVEDA